VKVDRRMLLLVDLSKVKRGIVWWWFWRRKSGREEVEEDFLESEEELDN